LLDIIFLKETMEIFENNKKDATFTFTGIKFFSVYTLIVMSLRRFPPNWLLQGGEETLFL